MKIIITGTSSGIGKAIALKFLAMGHFVIGIDKDDSTIDKELYTYKRKYFNWKIARNK